MTLRIHPLSSIALCASLLVAACTPATNAGAVDAATPSPGAPIASSASPSVASIPSSIPASPTPAPTSALAKAAAGNNLFASDLSAALGAASSGSTAANRVFSPASISGALAMTFGGARAKTADEMKKALHFDAVLDGPDGAQLHESWQGLLASWTAEDPKGVELHVANRLFGQTGFAFDPAFLTLTRDHYGAPLQALDFGSPEPSRKVINDWVDVQTSHRIVGLLPEGTLDASTRLVLVNAMHLKGAWATPFEAGATSKEPFALAGSSPSAKPATVDVDMMHGVFEARFVDTNAAQIVALPFYSPSGAHDLELDEIIPKGAAVPVAGADPFGAIGAQLDASKPRELSLAMPRFRVQSSFELAPTLSSMGMPSAFTAAADFSGIDGKKDLYISHVVHQAMLDVNENGAEAAAATAVVMDEKGLAMPPALSVRADHPFDVALRDRKTGAVLFVAHIGDPR